MLKEHNINDKQLLTFSYVSFTYVERGREREREMFYLTTHSTHFIYSYMASDIWLRTILIVRKKTRCRHIGYSYRLTARVLLYAPSHRQDNTYHSLCYTSHGALAGTRNSSMGPPHEGSNRRPTAPRMLYLWATSRSVERGLTFKQVYKSRTYFTADRVAVTKLLDWSTVLCRFRTHVGTFSTAAKFPRGLHILELDVLRQC